MTPHRTGMSKRKFPIKPSKCLSTHGGAGYVAGSYWENGSIVCGACGTRIKNPSSTGGFRNHPTYPDFIRGLPKELTRWGAREKYTPKWWEFWK